jgi:hypothetical protein
MSEETSSERAGFVERHRPPIAVSPLMPSPRRRVKFPSRWSSMASHVVMMAPRDLEAFAYGLRR